MLSKQPLGTEIPGSDDLSALTQIEGYDARALRSKVRERLRLAIAAEEIPAGTRLNQVKIAESLGVSRMPVRDAISDLLGEGLLVPLSGGGALVTPLTAQDIRDVYDVRIPLEATAVQTAAAHASDWHLDRIEAIIDRHWPLLERNANRELLELDRQFHWAVLEAAGNRHLLRSLVPVWATVSRAMFALLRIPSYGATAWNEHQDLALALRVRDGDRAEELIRLHLTKGRQQLLAVIPEE